MKLNAEAFDGRWALSRLITDRLAGQSGGLEGEASLTREGASGLRYAEEGQLRLGGGAPLLARRVYLWHFTGDAVEVRFEDGRAFHRFDAAGVGSDHPCGADLYRVRYEFDRWPKWSAVWQVSGPRKDYTMRSDYAPR